MDLQLANPRGFCAGVDRAIAVVNDLLELFGEPVFVRHEIVHNKVVVQDLRARGARFVEDVAEIPEGAVAVISAHGAAPSVFSSAKARSLRVFDATCPLVTRVQLKVARHAGNGESVIVIGHRGHAEVEGLLGCYDTSSGPGIFVVETEAEAGAITVPTPDRLGYVTQTTLALDQTRRIVEVLAARFPKLISPQAQDICYATQNRQTAVKTLAKECDLVLVIGAPHSSNSVRLCETVRAQGGFARLVETAAEINPDWLAGCRLVGLTASASAPEHVVQAVVARLREISHGLQISEIGVAENVVFRMPQALLNLQESAGLAKRSEREKAKNRLVVKVKEELSMNKLANTLEQSEALLSSVVKSAAELAVKARDLVEQAGGAAERELSMVLRLGEEARDRVVSEASLENARKMPLLHALRHDAHRVVDLGFDAVSVAYVSARDLLDSFAESRPARIAVA